MDDQQAHEEQTVRALTSADPEVRFEALTRLRALAKDNSSIKPYKSVLIDLLGDDRRAIRSLAAETIEFHSANFFTSALGTFHYDRYFNAVALLQSEEVDADERRALARYLLQDHGNAWRRWTIREPDGEGFADLSAGLHAPAPTVRVDALNEVAALLADGVYIAPLIDRLRALLSDDDPAVRWSAARVLVRFYGRFAMYNYAAYSDTVDQLCDGGAPERRKALDDLGAGVAIPFSDRDERDISFAIPAVAVALIDADAIADDELQRLALGVISIALSDHQDISDALPALVALCLDPARGTVRGDALAILDRALVMYDYDLTRFIPDLKVLLTAANENLRRAAASLLTSYSLKSEDWAAVRVLVAHSDAIVRAAAAAKLDCPSARRSQAMIGDLVRMHDDADASVRFEAARTTATQAGSVEALRPAIEVLLEFVSEREQGYEQRAIEALASCLRQQVRCDSAVPVEDWSIFDPVVGVLEHRLRTRRSRELKPTIGGSLTVVYLHTDRFDAIQALLRKRNNTIRKRVLSALGGCGRPCTIDPGPLIPMIVGLFLHDTNDDVRRYAQQRLEHWAETRPRLLERIEDALAELNADPSSCWPFIMHLYETRHYERFRDLSLELEALDQDRWVGHLAARLGDGDSVIGGWSARTLRDRSWPAFTGALNISEAAPALIAALEDPDRFVRLFAVEALGHHFAAAQPSPIASRSLLSLLADDLEPIRIAVLRTLTRVVTAGEPTILAAFDAIGSVLATDPAPSVRYEAAHFVFEAGRAGLDIGGIVDALCTGLTDEAALVRDTCARALARFVVPAHPELAAVVPEWIEERSVKKSPSVRELLGSCRCGEKDRGSSE